MTKINHKTIYRVSCRLIQKNPKLGEKRCLLRFNILVMYYTRLGVAR
jgi:hypothetical protein